METTVYAFIDAQNLHLGIKDQGWELDFARFKKYLSDKYNVTRAFLFIGYRSGNERLYTFLQTVGYICIFKPTLELPDGTVKGNVDAELVLHAMIEYLKEQKKLHKVIIPNQKKYSAPLKSLSTPEKNIFDFMNTLRNKLSRT